MNGTRKQIAKALGDSRFKLRHIDFGSLGYDDAYVLSVWNGQVWIETGSIFSRDFFDKNKALVDLMRYVQQVYTYKGRPII